MLDFTGPRPASTRAAVVTGELRRMIRSGDLPAGTRLRQVDIAERFSVSTTPVREAFTALAREGLVLQDAHRGVIVYMPSADDLKQNYEIRLALEPLATSFAAQHIDDKQIRALERLQTEMRKALRTDVPRYAAELNPTFHRLIYQAARRPRLAELIEQLRDAGASYTQVLSLTPQPATYLDAAQAEHEDILAALKDRDADRARDAMTAHLSDSRDQILASMQPAASATDAPLAAA